MAANRLLDRNRGLEIARDDDDDVFEPKDETILDQITSPEYWVTWTITSFGGVILLLILALGIAGFALSMQQTPVGVHSFCTNSTFYYFDRLPAVGDIGNYSSVWVERTGSHVHVYMQGLLFYGQDALDPGYWTSLIGYPASTAIGIDTRCLPRIKGNPSIKPIFVGDVNCTSAGTGVRYFNTGTIYNSALDFNLYATTLFNSFLVGGTTHAMCTANLPDPGVDVVYGQVLLNRDWFLASQRWVPYQWMVDFTYITDSSSDWSVPSHCQTQFREGCTMNRQ